MFDPHWRRRAVAAVEAGEVFDLVVVGGGITGCGIFFDASQRGLRVLLLEKQDFASGTSSRSSKLIHGGLRYLKELQLGVTRTASRERDRLSVLNPLLVRPFRFVYPASRGDETPAWMVDVGLWMYDRLTRRSQHHDHLTPDEIQGLLPGLETEHLDRAFSFTDALTDDARLTVAVAATGAAYGGLAITRAEMLEPFREGGAVRGVLFRDLESGRSHTARARLVVNATGVWVDAIRERLGLEGRRVRPSRGVHLVVAPEALPIEAAAMVPAADDGRPVFLIPHEGGVLVGTTDIFHDGDLDDPRATRAEVEYLRRTVEHHFPGRALGPRAVLGVYAGLRPILASHTDDPGEVSREEEIWEEGGLLHVAGGKLTTWRPTAEEAVDEALKLLPDGVRLRAGRCYTEGTPLAGVAPLDLAGRLTELFDLQPEVAAGMALRLREVALWTPQLARSPRELQPFEEGGDLTPAEVRAHLRHGAVVRLEDLLLRRARLGLWRPEAAARLAPRLEPWFREELGWDAARWNRELTAWGDAAQAWTPDGVVG
ncbi:MAG: glycerol-3-phosphate dehydrogenase/oxidase [Thermoanaerobaculia bacterium]